MHRKGSIHSRGDDLLRTKAAAAQVFVPGDFIVVEGSRKHIHIAIAIQVFCKDGIGAIGKAACDGCARERGLRAGLCKNKDWADKHKQGCYKRTFTCYLG